MYILNHQFFFFFLGNNNITFEDDNDCYCIDVLDKAEYNGLCKSIIYLYNIINIY